MEKIDEQLNNLIQVEVPIGVHQSVMRKINYSRIVPVLFIVFGILALNFIILAWRINAKLIDAEFVDMMQDFLNVFSFNASFVQAAIANFFEIVSPALVLSAALSLAGVIYTGMKIRLYQFSKI